MTKFIQPRISLVGAGPGDPDLLTIKGMKAIKTASVIMYDALVNVELLNIASPDTIKIFVGKRERKHKYSQDEINMMLVQNALTYGHVVRLKGGDSFVFGRGHEEKTYAELFNIPVDIVPGISSSISVPELQGVPVTCRGINESFWVLTGTTKDGNLSKDINIAVQSSATIIILMGIRKIEQIANLFLENNKGDIPVMVVQRGSYQDSKMVLGTAKDIALKVKQNEIGTPGIIVFGEVVTLHPSYEHCDQHTLKTQ